MPIKLFLVLAFALLVALFAVQNAGPITINLLGLSQLQVPLAAVIIGMLTIGVLLGALFSAPMLLVNLRRARELERELLKRDKEIAALKQSNNQQSVPEGH